jgi:hypothetical protein
MKEPLIVDFLEQFIAEHHLSTQPRPPSRAASIRSYISQNNRSSSRLSVRLSQAELLEFSRSSTPPSPLFNHKSLSRPISMISIDAALNSMEDENDNNDKLPITLSTA